MPKKNTLFTSNYLSAVGLPIFLTGATLFSQVAYELVTKQNMEQLLQNSGEIIPDFYSRFAIAYDNISLGVKAITSTGLIGTGLFLIGKSSRLKH